MKLFKLKRRSFIRGEKIKKEEDLLLSLAEDTFIGCYDFHLICFKCRIIKIVLSEFCKDVGHEAFNLLSHWRLWSWAVAYIKYWKCARCSTLADHRSHKRSRQKIHLRKVSPTVTDLQTPIILLVIKFLIAHTHTRTHTPFLTLLTLILTGTPYKRTLDHKLTPIRTHFTKLTQPFVLMQAHTNICTHQYSHAQKYLLVHALISAPTRV